MAELKLFVPCPRGLEPALVQELTALACRSIAASDGGVACTGDWADVYRINLHSRVASRVLCQVAHGRVASEQDAYELARQVPWPRWFRAEQTIKVKVEGKNTRLRRLDVVGLKVKDAVCDVFRADGGVRPSVNKANPDIRIHAFIQQQEGFLFVDTSGEALFKRGYRTDTGEAPLRENLAAGMLLLAGYDGSQPMLDPMCGSGTIVIEAALMATQRAPGLKRRFAFEQLLEFDAGLWQNLRQAAQDKILAAAPQAISGSDINRFTLKQAIKNAQQAGVDDVIDFQVRDVTECRPNGENGILMSNPPYGVRLEDEWFLQALYPQLGSCLKQYFAGWLACFLSADKNMTRAMRLTPKRKIPLFNGNLDCRLFVLEMVAGSNRV